jgi:hypothetical protein
MLLSIFICHEVRGMRLTSFHQQSIEQFAFHSKHEDTLSHPIQMAGDCFSAGQFFQVFFVLVRVFKYSSNQHNHNGYHVYKIETYMRRHRYLEPKLCADGFESKGEPEHQ